MDSLMPASYIVNIITFATAVIINVFMFFLIFEV